MPLPPDHRHVRTVGRPGTCATIAVGWSERSGRVVGYIAEARHEIAADSLKDDTCWTPDLAMNGLHAEEIRRAIEATKRGKGTASA